MEDNSYGIKEAEILRLRKTDTSLPRSVGAWEFGSDIDLIGSTVFSNEGERGTIKGFSYNEEYVIVSFPDREESFAYPDAFLYFLTFERDEYQESIACFLEERKESLLKRQMRKRSSLLKYDKIEDSLIFIIIENELEDILNLNSANKGIGYCHIYWSRKKYILSEYYNINWVSPARLNPGVLFD